MGVAQRRARLALVSAVALLVAACGDGGQGDPEGDGTSPASSTASSGSSSAPPSDGAVPVSYERPTVEPPGRLDASIVGDDLLVVGSETLPEELVEKIADIEVAGEPGVAAMLQFSMTQFPIENRVIDVAAVDAAEYRRFTPANSANHQETWDRVAGGEIAVSRSLERRLPLDKDGYVTLSTGTASHKVHVGAWADQVGTIEAVVNTAWAEKLGMVEGNALVISNLGVSPQAFQEKLEKLLDDDVSVYGLDVVAQYGLDPQAVQTAQFVGTFAEAVGVFRYTVLGGGRIAPDPAWVRAHIETQRVPLLGRLTCNKYMFPQLRAAMQEISRAGLGPEIEYHVGCYYPRFIAGSTTLSNHSFGLAIDINSLENQRGTVGQMHPTVVAIMKKWGFAWGGDWSWTDPMHFELARIVSPR
jgi:hypothetical protein